MSKRKKGRRKRRAVPQADLQQQALDKLIDCELEEFQEHIIKEQIPVGQIHGLRILLNNCYLTLVRSKDLLLERIKTNPEEEEECKFNIQRCYIVMEKIEAKCVWLHQREKELLGSVTSD